MPKVRDNGMREFIRLEFADLLLPLYVKTCTDSVCFVFEARHEEGNRMYLKFKTGRFPHNNEGWLFNVLSVTKNEYGRSIVEIMTQPEQLKSLRFVEMYEDSDEIKWSRRYYSEKFGFSYSDEAKELTTKTNCGHGQTKK